MKQIKEKQHMRSPKQKRPDQKMPRTLSSVYERTRDLANAPENEESPDGYADETIRETAFLSVNLIQSGGREASRGVSNRLSDDFKKTSPQESAAYNGNSAIRSCTTGIRQRPDPKERTLSVPSGHPEEYDGVHAPSPSSSGRSGVPSKTRTDALRNEPSPQGAITQRLYAPDPKNLSFHRPEQDPRNTLTYTAKTKQLRLKEASERNRANRIRLIKTPQRFVRMAHNSISANAKTVRSVQRSAKNVERAAKAAKEASAKSAKAAAKGARLAAKAAEAAVKAIVSAVKELVSLLMAGGWAAALAVGILGVCAVLVASCFGLFWSNDLSQGSPMTAIIASVNRSYEKEIGKAANQLASGIEHDELMIEYRGDNNDGDSVTVNNWNDVLAIFAVRFAAGSHETLLIEPSEQTEAQLREVFYAMNTVTLSYEIEQKVPEDAPVPTPDAEGNVPKPDTVTVLTVNVHMKAKTYREAADYYAFTESERQMLDEMMSPAYYGYYAKLIGLDVLDGLDYTGIISHLPSNSKGAEVVKAAMTRLGCPYLMGAKGSTKFDCSGLAYWSIKQVDPELGDRMYTNAAGQAKYCYDRGLTVGRSELEPGDLVFWVNKKCDGCHRWKEIHHVGIYIGEGKVIEAASGKGRVLIRDLWETKNYPILMFGRPYQ